MLVWMFFPVPRVRLRPCLPQLGTLKDVTETSGRKISKGTFIHWVLRTEDIEQSPSIYACKRYYCIVRLVMIDTASILSI